MSATLSNIRIFMTGQQLGTFFRASSAVAVSRRSMVLMRARAAVRRRSRVMASCSKPPVGTDDEIYSGEDGSLIPSEGEFTWDIRRTIDGDMQFLQQEQRPVGKAAVGPITAHPSLTPEP